MKINKINVSVAQTMLLIGLLVLMVSCGTNNEPEIVNKPTVPTAPQFYLSHVSIFPGLNEMPYHDPVSFGYDKMHRIINISTRDSNTTVSYPDSNLITCHEVMPTVSNADIQIDTKIYLDSGRVKRISVKDVTKFYSNNMITVNYDSIVFSYNSDKSLRQIRFFEKNDYYLTFVLRKNYEYTYENGNLVKFAKTDYSVITIINYAYDDKPRVDYSDYTTEMPFESIFLYPLIYNKLGRKSVNNIVRATFSYPQGLGNGWSYDYINYEYLANSNKVVTGIKMSGQVINKNGGIKTYDSGLATLSYSAGL